MCKHLALTNRVQASQSALSPKNLKLYWFDRDRLRHQARLALANPTSNLISYSTRSPHSTRR